MSLPVGEHPPHRGCLVAFEISLHGRPADTAAGRPYVDAWGTWPTLSVPRSALATPMTVGFDAFLDALAELERLYVEPDGSFVWTSPREDVAWQVDGNAYEREGRVLLVDVKGVCPESAFDCLLGALGWPGQPLVMQLVRPAVFLDESSFRRHAAARAAGEWSRQQAE